MRTKKKKKPGTDLKKLERLFKLCRSYGVAAFAKGDVQVQFHQAQAIDTDSGDGYTVMHAISHPIVEDEELDEELGA